MRILFTADLHLNIPARNPRTGRTAFDVFAEHIASENPDVVVVAGDIGSSAQASQHLAAIRNVAGDRALAIALGNHDFWVDRMGHAQYSTLDQVVTRFWREPTRDVDAILLDSENLDLGGLAIVGGYGHFDLGFAEPNLHVRGKRITEDIYLSEGLNGLFWNDFRYIPNCGTSVQSESHAQAAGIAVRMDSAIAAGKRVLLAIHTCPWRELNGHPLRGDEADILSAYSGNSLVGKEIEKRAASVDFLMCGHTHMPVREHLCCGIPSLNVGADYGRFRGVIYESESKVIRWIGEPFGS